MSAITQRLPRSVRNPAPTVLVVDDVDCMRSMLDYALRHYGFSVHLAENGRKAIELYASCPERFAAVLLDLQMPNVDGVATLKALKLINPFVRSCLMSTGPLTRQEWMSTGADAFLEKPFPLLQLVDVLKQVIRNDPGQSHKNLSGG